MDDNTAVYDDVIVRDVSAAPCPVAYFAIAPLFLLCALGFWTGGGDSGRVTLAVIGLTVAAVITAVHGWRLQRRVTESARVRTRL